MNGSQQRARSLHELGFEAGCLVRLLRLFYKTSELARMFNTSESTISRWGSGKSSIPSAYLERLVALFSKVIADKIRNNVNELFQPVILRDLLCSLGVTAVVRYLDRIAYFDYVLASTDPSIIIAYVMAKYLEKPLYILYMAPLLPVNASMCDVLPLDDFVGLTVCTTPVSGYRRLRRLTALLVVPLPVGILARSPCKLVEPLGHYFNIREVLLPLCLDEQKAKCTETSSLRVTCLISASDDRGFKG